MNITTKLHGWRRALAAGWALIPVPLVMLVTWLFSYHADEAKSQWLFPILTTELHVRASLLLFAFSIVAAWWWYLMRHNRTLANALWEHGLDDDSRDFLRLLKRDPAGPDFPQDKSFRYSVLAQVLAKHGLVYEWKGKWYPEPWIKAITRSK